MSNLGGWNQNIEASETLFLTTKLKIILTNCFTCHTIEKKLNTNELSDSFICLSYYSINENIRYQNTKLGYVIRFAL